MSIQFTQYMFPNGRRRTIIINLDKEIEKIAESLICRSVRFDIEILTTGVISMTAYADVENPLAIELCRNGPEVRVAVKKLIKSAEAELERRNDAENRC